ncbi:MAG TPA: hypothetical protein DF613_04585 [Lachnospiraceae bacterium]|nr:hypothetical protein [Lachnospiraceae bacterium]
MAEIIAAIICFVFSIGSFIISIRSFMEKGYLFNNAYLYATKQERIQMNKRPYYRQSAVVFLLMGILFLLTAVLALFYTKWIFYIVMAIAAIMIVYAVGSSIIIEKRNKNCN